MTMHGKYEKENKRYTEKDIEKILDDIEDKAKAEELEENANDKIKGHHLIKQNDDPLW